MSAAFTPSAYGAVGDKNEVDDGKMEAGSPVLTASGSFKAGAVGKVCVVGGAGSASKITPLVAKIVSREAANKVTLDKPAGASVTDASVAWYTDDTAALQKCLDAAGLAARPHRPSLVLIPPLRYGLTLAQARATDLYRPPGNHLFYGLKTYANVHIEGATGSAICLPFTDIQFPHTACGITNAGADDENFSIRGLTVDGLGRAETTEEQHYGIVVSGRARGFQIEENEATGWQGKGIHVLSMYDGSGVCSSFDIRRNNVHDCAHGQAIALGYGADDFVIDDNRMDNLASPGTAESFGLSGGQWTNGRISRNRTIGWGNWALTFNGVDIDIKDNTVILPAGAGSNAAACDASVYTRVRILDNTFDASAAPACRGIGNQPDVWDTVTLRGNILRGNPEGIPANHAMWLTGNSFIDCKVLENDLSGGEIKLSAWADRGVICAGNIAAGGFPNLSGPGSTVYGNVGF